MIRRAPRRGLGQRDGHAPARRPARAADSRVGGAGLRAAVAGMDAASSICSLMPANVGHWLPSPDGRSTSTSMAVRQVAVDEERGVCPERTFPGPSAANRRRSSSFGGRFPWRGQTGGTKDGPAMTGSLSHWPSLRLSSTLRRDHVTRACWMPQPCSSTAQNCSRSSG